MSEWDVSYTELVEWISKTGAELYAINTYGSNLKQNQYAFTDEKDYIAFKLTFQKGQKPITYRSAYTASFYTNPSIPK
jgi:hypothetical protein